MVTTGLNPNSVRTFLRKRKTMASKAPSMKKGLYKKTVKKSSAKKVVRKTVKKAVKKVAKKGKK